MDSTALSVCQNQRISSNKVFKDVAKRGKTSTGYFYGFKLHVAIHDCGETLAFASTQGTVDEAKVACCFIFDKKHVWKALC